MVKNYHKNLYFKFLIYKQDLKLHEFSNVMSFKSDKEILFLPIFRYNIKILNSWNRDLNKENRRYLKNSEEESLQNFISP